MVDTPETSMYRRGVGICVVDRQGLALVGRRIDDPTRSWQMPQGGLMHMEDPRSAALRELREETCITSVSLIGELEGWYSYRFPPNRKVRKGAEHIIGQMHKWFLFRFTGLESEIRVRDADDPEFLEHSWMQLHLIPHQVVDYKKPVYEKVCYEFGKLLSDN